MVAAALLGAAAPVQGETSGGAYRIGVLNEALARGMRVSSPRSSHTPNR